MDKGFTLKFFKDGEQIDEGGRWGEFETREEMKHELRTITDMFSDSYFASSDKSSLGESD